VDVAGTLLDRLAHDVVHHADDLGVGAVDDRPVEVDHVLADVRVFGVVVVARLQRDFADDVARAEQVLESALGLQ
jgi:hypothetical protein